MRKEYRRNVSRWGADYPVATDARDVIMAFNDHMDADESPELNFSELATHDQARREPSYNPAFHDQSPGSDSGPESASSPLGPLTPFDNFVDRVSAAGQPRIALEDEVQAQHHIEYDSLKHEKAPVFPSLADDVKEADPFIPSATNGYRQLAQPLSEWLASYVWKACTTGLSLSPVFTQPSGRVVHYSPVPPSYLAPSIHSLLLSTLLQPSAIFLGLWYIIRLPGYFNAADLGAEYPKETRFRHALLGDAYSYEREGLELNAPFRLVVLGCMLANKWLDDHTFSNKTWHTISNIPIQELNRYEALALDVFAYDLSISNKEWAHWMSHLKAYHMSSAPSQLQPIGRPSSNPHSMIRRAIDEIVQAPTPDSFSPLPRPVFLGLEERKQEKVDGQYGPSVDILEINLDEGGPLREEYLPRRRTNAGAHASRDVQPPSQIVDVENVPAPTGVPTKTLPPPAKWSPSGDEPILRDRNRSSGHYVAVQPSQTQVYPIAYRPHDVACNPSWDAPFGVPFKGYPTYGFGHAPVPMNAPTYTLYPQPTTHAMTHSRSQSLFYDSDNFGPRHHGRSLSQAGDFRDKCGDMHTMPQEHLPTYENEPHWIDTGRYMYPMLGYAPAIAIPTVNTAWLRA